MQNLDRILNTWIGDVFNDMNTKLLDCNTCIMYALSGKGKGNGMCFSTGECSGCISQYMHQEEKTDDKSICMWHYKLIPILPTKLLKKQWKDCMAIAENISRKGFPCCSNCNKVSRYPIQQFRDYCNMILLELNNRKIRLPISQIQLMDSLIGFEVDTLNIHRDIFNKWHTDEYMRICGINIAELYYSSKLISEEDMDKVVTFVADYMKERQ